MNDDTIGLSRRKMLVGLGAVGVASAGAGLGTTAYFNDTESFDDNTLTAGELDLFVHVDYSEDQGSYAQYSTPDGTFIDGVVGGGEGDPLSIQVSDLKPGDSGEGEFCFSIVDNPAYMWMCGAVTENNENGQSEPEMDADTTGGDPGEGMGELADAMQVTVSYCTDDDGEYALGEEIASGSLADVMSALDNGIPSPATATRRPRSTAARPSRASTRLSSTKPRSTRPSSASASSGRSRSTWATRFRPTLSRSTSSSTRCSRATTTARPTPVSPPVRSRASASRTTSRTPTCCGPQGAQRRLQHLRADRGRRQQQRRHRRLRLRRQQLRR